MQCTNCGEHSDGDISLEDMPNERYMPYCPNCRTEHYTALPRSVPKTFELMLERIKALEKE